MVEVFLWQSFQSRPSWGRSSIPQRPISSLPVLAFRNDDTLVFDGARFLDSVCPSVCYGSQLQLQTKQSNMALTESTMLELGTPVPDFDLPDPAGERVRLRDFADAEGLIVAFICNHCPFVKHIREEVAAFAKEYMQHNIAMVAINANDVSSHPADAPEQMREEAETLGYGFPYVYDESQETAKAYRAACTPEFYLFDKERKLVYRGRFDGSTPSNGEPVTGNELRRATDAVLAGNTADPDQRPGIGCNIKWKPGNEPDYFG